MPVAAFAVLVVTLMAVSALAVATNGDSEEITADDLVFYDCDDETILYEGVDAKDGKIVFPKYDGAASEFYGWVNGDKKYQANKDGGATEIEVSEIEDKKFYAIPMENPVTCKITFNANGGESCYANMTGKVDEESLVNEYIWKVDVVGQNNGDTRFVGWEYNGTIYIEDSILVLPSDVSEITLKANWANYVIYYKEKTPNNHSRLIHVQTSQTEDFTILTYGGAGGNQRDFKFTNWELHGGDDGIFGKSYTGGESFDMSEMIGDGARDTSVEAQGVFTYTVKYFVDGNKVHQEKVEAGQTVNLLDWKNYESSNEQFVIEGWAGPEDGLDSPERLDYEDGDDSNLVWYRQNFIMKDMNYKFEAYGKYSVQYYDYDGSLLKTAGPYYPREGFNLEKYTGSGVGFEGWQIYVDGEKAVDEENGLDQFQEDYPLDGRDKGVMKIYAVAYPSPDAPVERHTIRLDVNGGDLQLDPVTVTASAYAVPDYAGKKAGYDFVGWEYGGRTYTPGQSIPLPSGVTEISLTAVWKDPSSPSPTPDTDEVLIDPADRVVVIETPVGPVTVEVLGDADPGDSIYVHVSMRKAGDGEGVPGMDDTTILESYCYRLTSAGQKVPMTYRLTVSAGIDVPSGKESVIGLYDREGAEVDGIDVTFSSGSAVFETTADDSLYLRIGAMFRTVVLPVVTTGDEAYVYYDDESDFWFGKDPKSLLLIAILAAIVAELAALTISRRG